MFHALEGTSSLTFRKTNNNMRGLNWNTITAPAQLSKELADIKKTESGNIFIFLWQILKELCVAIYKSKYLF